MRRKIPLFTMLGFLIQLSSFATEAPKGILFQSGVMVMKPYKNISSLNKDFNELKAVNGEKYFMIQLSELPTEATIKRMEATGLKLLHYVPHHAYFVSTPANYNVQLLSAFKLINIAKIPTGAKLNEALRGPVFDSNIEKKGNKYFINVQSISKLETLRGEIAAKNISIEKPRYDDQILNVWVDRNEILWLANHPLVMWVEPAAPEGEPEDREGRSLHRSSTIDNSLVGGRRFDGTGVVVGIADDGAIGPHIDFSGRLTQYTNDFTPGNTHGDMVAGIAVGSGNLDPTKIGHAPGAYLHMYGINNYPHINGAVANFNTLGTTITSTSYSEVNGGIYSASAVSTDLQVFDNPQLLHVFSAGNAGTANHTFYPATWGNITGGRKAGKNVIAVANLRNTDQLENSSSRGPARDGRIKPDIAANGYNQRSTGPNNTYLVGGGTSAASPSIAGIMAQLSHAYKTFNNNQNPPAGLLKAVAFNTTEDLGNPGPDFRFGWGRINAGRAVDLIQQNRYIDTLIGQNDTVLHEIPVPTGVAQLRVMIYWMDRPGTANSLKALVNDLDLTLVQGANVFNPLVLNPSNNTIALNSDAVPGIDTLNNVEQVVINNPIAGAYLARIVGKTIPLGNQRYFLVYEYIRDEIKVTYPMGGEGFVPGETELIRWDAFGTTGTFNVEYSTNNGTSWININTAPGTSRFLAWQVPNTVGSNYRIRVRKGNTQFGISDTSFTVVGLPDPMNISFICTDSVGLSWSPVSGATGYIVYKLDTMYMDSIGFTTNTFFTSMGNNLTQEDWFSVAAVVNGKVGRRRNAIRKQPNIIQACQQPPVANFSVNTTTVCLNEPITLSNTSLNGATTFNWSISPNTFTYVNGTNATSQNPQVSFSSMGSYNVQLIAGNQFGNDTLLRPNFLQTTLGNTLPLINSFANAIFPEPNWLVENPDNGLTWVRFGVSGGPTPQIVSAVRVNNFSYNAIGQEDYLILPILQIPASGNALLTFSVAHAQYSSTYNDGLRIDVSTNCGDTYQPTGYLKTGPILATTATTTASFVPTNAAQWRTDTLNLSAYAGQSIRIRIANICGYGNNTYITNIKVATPGLTAGFSTNGLNCIGEQIIFTDASSGGTVQTYNWNFGVGASPATANTAGPHTVTYSSDGLKNITLVVNDSIGQDSILNTVLIEIGPSSNFFYNIVDGSNVTFINTGNNAQSITWDFGDGTSGSGTSVAKSYTQSGSYTVKQYATNSCGVDSSTQVVDIIMTNVENLAATDMKLYPNPANGFINFEVSGLVGSKHNLQVLDVLGRIVYQEQFASEAKQFKTTLQTSEWNSGVYFIRLSSNEGVSRVSFVVQH